MKITKFGHSCLLIEENNTRILTDPGIYSFGQDDLKNIDAILITHEHTDHINIESVKVIIKSNPQIKIYTNKSVGEMLQKEGIEFNVVETKQNFSVNGVDIETFGTHHEIMHSSMTPCLNLGFFIANKLFYPGDIFTDPGKPVKILALPVSGPWMKLSEAIDYAIKLKPKVCFPVHDGILKNQGSVHIIPPKILEPLGIEFTIIEEGQSKEF